VDKFNTFKLGVEANSGRFVKADETAGALIEDKNPQAAVILQTRDDIRCAGKKIVRVESENSISKSNNVAIMILQTRLAGPTGQGCGSREEVTRSNGNPSIQSRCRRCTDAHPGEVFQHP
jgi:hypothetical protein